MNRRQRALARRYERDPAFRHEFDRAASPQEAVAIAAAFGLTLQIADLAAADDDVTDAELDTTAAGMTAAQGVCWTNATCVPYCVPG